MCAPIDYDVHECPICEEPCECAKDYEGETGDCAHRLLTECKPPVALIPPSDSKEYQHTESSEEEPNPTDHIGD